ncbi:MAG: diguanylate cyclase [Deltaproteobacteria bacterium]|nr:diguanylate cyclase [bacterium]MCB9478566.1 diguanylate cyclase [Deltaproteobacteria bacterium]MCB9488353.1 diguanylate cyclase [Deltaproteobacteria bacterium]
MAATTTGRKIQYRDLIIITVIGVVVGLFFTTYFKVRGYDALTMILSIPIAFLAVSRGLRHGALMSIIGAAIYGTVILFTIIQGQSATQPGVIREGIANITVLIALGFILGIIFETFNFQLASPFKEVTTVETFVPDEETGLYNFKSFRWMLSGEMKRVKRYNTPMSLIFVRVDNLADFQRRYDYEQEIILYRELGRFLRGLLRDADYVGKYSDAEIGIILPETNANGVNIVMTRVAERRAALLESMVERWDEVPPQLSLSATNFPKDADNLEELVNVLDARYKPF